MERTRYRIEVGRQGLEAIEDANGSWEYHADAQRTIDAEREANRLGRRQIEAVDLERQELQNQLATLQAQLESANVLIYKKNCAIGRADTTIQTLMHANADTDLQSNDQQKGA